MPETPELNFRKSSYSGPTTQDCVEVADTVGASAMRDSKDPDAGHILFPASEWGAFMEDVKAGRL
ncbi:DUF397 domain-containing protein [Streptomonospora salina]|uniref:DUF397 domain-containing protein n=1 Tax=Streptomonospora salina TaxID=104205 RepID=A0A841E500_9ACTN|nr:DUF397 domain-containing protein [Streptomonospora salina]MBB5997852.1 hypothetical protein [Streptomonospora salina]